MYGKLYVCRRHAWYAWGSQRQSNSRASSAWSWNWGAFMHGVLGKGGVSPTLQPPGLGVGFEAPSMGGHTQKHEKKQ